MDTTPTGTVGTEDNQGKTQKQIDEMKSLLDGMNWHDLKLAEVALDLLEIPIIGKPLVRIFGWCISMGVFDAPEEANG